MRPSASNPNAIEIFCMRASTSAHARTQIHRVRVGVCSHVRGGRGGVPHRARERELAGAEARGRRADGRLLSQVSSTHMLLASKRKTDFFPPPPTHRPLSPKRGATFCPPDAASTATRQRRSGGASSRYTRGTRWPHTGVRRRAHVACARQGARAAITTHGCQPRQAAPSLVRRPCRRGI